MRGDPGAPPHIGILLPEGTIPWAGHTGRYAAAQVYKLIAAHRLTIVFVNTRAVAEMVFRDLWTANDDALPIAIHHGSLAPEARHKVEAAMAAGRLRAIVATASLDLGIDWKRCRSRRPDGGAHGRVAAAATHRPRQPPDGRTVKGCHRPGQPIQG